MRARDAYIRQRLEKTDNPDDPYIRSMRELPEDLSTLKGRIDLISISIIKALNMIPIQQAHLTRYGLQEQESEWNDRPMMLAEPSKKDGAKYQRFSQREAPQLSQIRQFIDKYGGYRTIAARSGHSPKIYAENQFAVPTADIVTVEAITGKVMLAEKVENDVIDQIRRYLGKFRADADRIVLLRSPKQPQRMEGDSAVADDMYFTDGGQMLVTNQASLDFFNVFMASQSKEPMKASAFRPNIHLQGLPPHIEDVATGIIIDEDFEILFDNPCIRCAVTSVDQDTGEKRGKSEPLQDLLVARPLRLDGSSNRPTFGTNATSVIPKGAGSYRISNQSHVRMLGEKQI